MDRVKTALCIAAGLLVTLGSALHAQPPMVNQPAVSDWGTVVFLETGWSADTMSVLLSVPTVSSKTLSPAGPPRSCSVMDAGYALDPADPGVHAHQAVLLGAFLNGKQVRVRVQGCVYDKPRIIAVAIQN